jgi:hypothetical protein
MCPYSLQNNLKIHPRRVELILRLADTLLRSSKGFRRVFRRFLEGFEILREEWPIAWVSGFRDATEVKTIVSGQKSAQYKF